jgi:hypothetical protein
MKMKFIIAVVEERLAFLKEQSTLDEIEKIVILLKNSL